MKTWLKYITLVYLIFWSFFGVSQMVVEDVQGNTLKRVSLQIQTIEKKVSTASNIVLTAMSGDMTSTMEKITRQNAIFENSRQLRKSLGDAIAISHAYRTFKLQTNVTKRAVTRTNKKLKDLSDQKGVNASSIRKLNYTLKAVSYTLRKASDLWVAASDLDDEIDRVTRLKMMQESQDMLIELERKTLPMIDNEIASIEFEKSNRPQQLQFLLPPTDQSLSAGHFNDDRPKLSSFSSLWEKQLDSTRMKQILQLVFGYGDMLVLVIICMGTWFVLKARGTGKVYAVLRNIAYLLLAIVFIKVLAFNII